QGLAQADGLRGGNEPPVSTKVGQQLADDRPWLDEPLTHALSMAKDMTVDAQSSDHLSDERAATDRWHDAFGKILPLLAGALFLLAWEVAVRELHVSKFILPPPSLIIATLFEQRGDLFHALLFTAAITLTAFLLAIVTGVALGILLTQ